MTVYDEHDVDGPLGVTLDDFTPGPLPLCAVITRGRAMLIRRRIAAATAVAAVGATSILALQVGSEPMAFAVMSARQVKNWPPSPAVPPRYHVTVHAPGPGSAPGLFAYGQVNGTAWRVTGVRGTIPAMPQACIVVVVVVTPHATGCQIGELALASRHGVPADLGTISSSLLRIVAGAVRAEVAYLRVSLSNGQELTLRPVAAYGRGYARYVAFAVPFGAAVTLIRAYSRRRELAYAVPFTADGSVTTGRWISAGQPALPRPVAYLIGSGKVDGEPWAAKLYVGPWGSCLTLGGRGDCMPEDPAGLARGHVEQVMVVSLGSKASQLHQGDRAHAGAAAAGHARSPVHLIMMAAVPSVRDLMIRQADGNVISVRVAEAMGAGFAVIISRQNYNDKAVSWVAYPATGRALGWGQVN